MKIENREYQKRIRFLMFRENANQKTFAEKVNLSNAILSKVLKTNYHPRLSTLERIATVCNVSLDWLLGVSKLEDELK